MVAAVSEESNLGLSLVVVQVARQAGVSIPESVGWQGVVHQTVYKTKEEIQQLRNMQVAAAPAGTTM